MRKCVSCGVEKSESCFCRNINSRNGINSICRECKKKYDRERYLSKRGFILEQTRRYRRTVNGRISAARIALRQRNRFPEKYKARYIVKNAVTSGRLEKKPCEVCGNLKVEAHHEDYSKPLKVMWLCKKHHMEKDKTCGQ